MDGRWWLADGPGGAQGSGRGGQGEASLGRGLASSWCCLKQKATGETEGKRAPAASPGRREEQDRRRLRRKRRRCGQSSSHRLTPRRAAMTDAYCVLASWYRNLPLNGEVVANTTHRHSPVGRLATDKSGRLTASHQAATDIHCSRCSQPLSMPSFPPAYILYVISRLSFASRLVKPHSRYWLGKLYIYHPSPLCTVFL